MTITETRCQVVTCNGCGLTYDSYEEQYTVHFKASAPTHEINKDLVEARWAVENGEHYCEHCSCARRGHPLEPELSNGDRFCTCGKRLVKADVVTDRQGRI